VKTEKILKMDEAPLHGQVLSIQSHVVHGHVGNRAAVFPLELLGFEVDFINSVQFSNNTGYKSFKGQRLTGQDVEDLLQGLIDNDLCYYTHMLTGYMGTKTFLSSVMKVVDHMKSQNPNLIYVCDPVLGDDGKLYVPPELIDIYRNDIIPRADVITPNQFEAERLSGITIKCQDDALRAIDYLHGLGVPTVILTSAAYENRQGNLTLVASKKDRETGQIQRFEIIFPKLPGDYTGTGDLMAALFLAWLTILKNDFKLALETALAGIQSVLTRTPSGQELRLIQSRHQIPNPNIQFQATPLNQ
jgi:pyridoxine kinase